MAKYIMQLSGSVGVERLEITRDLMNDSWAREDAKKRIVDYYPVYYQIDLFGPDGKHMNRFKTEITAKEV